MLFTEGLKHGSKEIVSMLEYYFTEVDPFFGAKPEMLLYADSYGGQNRNNIMVSYLYSHVFHQQNERIALRFRAVGHTKFEPDQGFGAVQTKLRRANVYCLDDLCEIIGS